MELELDTQYHPDIWSFTALLTGAVPGCRKIGEMGAEPLLRAPEPLPGIQLFLPFNLVRRPL